MREGWRRMPADVRRTDRRRSGGPAFETYCARPSPQVPYLEVVRVRPARLNFRQAVDAGGATYVAERVEPAGPEPASVRRIVAWHPEGGRPASVLRPTGWKPAARMGVQTSRYAAMASLRQARPVIPPKVPFVTRHVRSRRAVLPSRELCLPVIKARRTLFWPGSMMSSLRYFRVASRIRPLLQRSVVSMAQANCSTPQRSRSVWMQQTPRTHPSRSLRLPQGRRVFMSPCLAARALRGARFAACCAGARFRSWDLF